MTTAGDNDDGSQATVGLPGATIGPDAWGDGVTPGTRIGRYRLLSLLGRGGMGEVYIAHQDEPVRRTVALKLLRARHLDTRRLSHFEVERQLLAQMRHPAIAQIHDAGTTADGRPYSAMELIDGLPVTGYCASQGLPLRARLDLFVRICEGVQHAHQKGVVHRDLKPGNILVASVDGRAVPKIIDFGIASIPSAGSSDGCGDALGTPAYMSPEQASAPDEVDTRSDIYSLGVLLHELLCGHRPESSGQAPFRPSVRFAALPEQAREQVARDLGLGVAALRRTLVRELDWVVARATAPDRGERYSSVTELADDLQRFSQDLTLAAVPDRRRYRWGKFVRRHRGGLAVAGVVVLAMVGGLGASLYGLDQARSQQALAEERARQLEAVSGFQQAMLEDVDVEAMGLGLAASLRGQIARAAPGEMPALERVLAHAGTADIARELIGGNILARAEEAIGRDFADQPALAADLTEAVARVRSALGMYPEAATGFGEVADARMRLFERDARPALHARREQISALLQGGPEQLQAALGLLEQVRGSVEALAPDDPLRIGFQFHEAMAETADDPHARRARLEVLLERSRERLGERDPATLEVANNFAILLTRLGELDAAGELLGQLVPTYAEVSGELSRETLGAKQNLAVVLMRSNDREAAIGLQRSLVADQQRRFGAEHPATLAARGNLANMLTDSGRSEEALPLALAVLEARERVLGAEHPQTIRSRLNASSALARAGRHEEALEMQAQVIEARTRLLGPAHPDTIYMLINRPATLHQAGRSAEALGMMARVLPLARETLGDGHPTTQMAMNIQAMVASESGDHQLAVDSFRALLEWRLAVQGHGDWRTIEAAWQLAGALRDAGSAEADALWARHVQPLLDTPPEKWSPGQRDLVGRIREAGDAA